MTRVPAKPLAAQPLGRRAGGEELLARYRRTGDIRARDCAIERYMPLARRLAARYHRHQESFEDLVQVANLGLVKAVERYDPGRGTRFTSFAVPTISGELRRHFRGTAWTLHVPRGVQEDALSVRDAASRLTHRHGRAPRISELVEETGLDAEAISEALHARAAQATASLDQPAGSAARDGDATLGELIGAEDERYALVERQADVEPLLRALPEREREVLFLRFARDMTQSEIAKQVGCSQMQVSRILRRTLMRLGEQAAHDAGGRAGGSLNARRRMQERAHRNDSQFAGSQSGKDGRAASPLPRIPGSPSPALRLPFAEGPGLYRRARPPRSRLGRPGDDGGQDGDESGARLPGR